MFIATVCIIALLGVGVTQQTEKATSAQVNKSEKPRSQPEKEADKKKRDPDIEALIGEARQVPPELTAEALIRIAESDKVKNRGWKLELFEEAFRTASNVQYPYRLRGAGHTDTRSGMLNSAHSHINLNALTLKCRVVKAVLPLDRKRGRELFEEIPKIKLESLTCADTTFYDVADYYQTLTDVANTAFSPEEIKREENIFFVQSRISAITSPFQVGPTAKTIATIQATPAQISLLTLSFLNALKKVTGEAKAFTEATRYMFFDGVYFLHRQLQAKGIASEDLLNTCRDYLVRHLSSTRCGATNKAYSDIVSRFNKFVEAEKGSRDKMVLPLAVEEIKPTKMEPDAEIIEYWQSPTAKTFLLRLKQLRFGVAEPPKFTGEKSLTETERTEPKWQKQLADFIQDFRSWRAEHEKTESDYFHQKCMALWSLFELIPDDTTREGIMREYVSFLSDSSLQRDHPMEWLLHAQRLVRFALAKDQTYDQADSWMPHQLVRFASAKEQPKIYEAITNLGSPALVFYAKLGKMFPQKS